MARRFLQEAFSQARTREDARDKRMSQIERPPTLSLEQALARPPSPCRPGYSLFYYDAALK